MRNELLLLSQSCECGIVQFSVKKTFVFVAFHPNSGSLFFSDAVIVYYIEKCQSHFEIPIPLNLQETFLDTSVY